MKKILLGLLIVSGNVLASGDHIILKETKVFNVNINEETVSCFDPRLMSQKLIVEISELDSWTLLDQRVTNFGQGPEKGSQFPAMRAQGICKTEMNSDTNPNGLVPADIIQGNPRIEVVHVTRVVSEAYLDLGHACLRVVGEKISAVIGGVEFANSKARDEMAPESACRI